MTRILIPFFIAFFWVLPLILPSTPTAQPQSSGMIKGKVLNGTTGGKAVPGVEVILYQYGDEQEKQRGSTKTDGAGVFSFSGLSLEEEKAYYVRAMYKGVEYYSPTLSFGDKGELLFDLSVYETTDEDMDISVKMHHVFMGLDGGILRVQEIMILENHGNRVYVGSKEVEPGKREVFRISLPEKATAFEPLKGLMGCCIIKTADGFIDTMDIKPGKKEMRFSYQVDYGSSRYKLIKGLYAKTESIDFLIPDTGIEAKSDTLEFRRTRGNSGQRFLHLSGRDLGRGSRIVLELSGLPWGKGLVKWATVGLVIAIVGGGLTYPFVKSRMRNGAMGKPSDMGSEGVHPVGRREELLREIARLDDLFEVGEIGSGEYRSQRKQIMEKAKEATRLLREMASKD